jgi:hypothetical protein
MKGISILGLIFLPGTFVSVDITSHSRRTFLLLNVVYIGYLQYEFLYPHHKPEYRIARLGFLKALLALLGSGATSNCSHVDSVVLLAKWLRPKMGEGQAVSVLLSIPIERTVSTKRHFYCTIYTYPRNKMSVEEGVDIS